MKKRKFYLTTAIDYVNAPVHLGHSFEKVLADVIARYQRNLKKEVFFLTGTDENAQKNVLAAKEAGVLPKKFVDQNANFAKNLWKKLGISFDYFIRTTNKKVHWPGVKKIWLQCQKSGDIYKKRYQGLYCLGCEAFLKKRDLKDGLCKIHLKKPQRISEENYFFRLSKYQKELKKIFEEEKIKIFPKEKTKEVLNFIDQGLEDLSISRPRERMRGWGIPVPGDKSQIVYVWFDALTNYISALGYGSNEKNFKKFWPADLQIIGKDILKFHAIFWPAMLLSAKLDLPKAIFIHGFVTVSGQKMSKSLGNIINPLDLIEKYGADALRYFLLREGSPFGDVDFTYEKFKERYNSDLAKGLGNLVARILKMAQKTRIQKKFDFSVKSKIKETWQKYQRAIEEFKFNEALIFIWDLISFADLYIEKERPWEKTFKKGKAIFNLLLILENLSRMLNPLLPETSEKILNLLKRKKKKILFPKI